jgi:hypothetical protein
MKAAIEDEQGCCSEKDGSHDNGESCFHVPDMPPGAIHVQPTSYAVFRPKTGDVRLMAFQPK